jgi:CO/xanthine dehydrogenase Mo-binding subunit
MQIYSRVKNRNLPPPENLDAWLTVQPDNSITVFTGKVDLGTGVETALSQIVAEELDVTLGQVSLMQGDTSQTPDQGGTWASTSIAYGGQQLRLAAASARKILLDLAAARLNVPAPELVVSAGTVSPKNDSTQKVTYGELVTGQSLSARVDPNAKTKPSADYTVVGVSAPRVDIPAKMTGGFTYVHDVRVPDMLHGRVIRPTPGTATKLVSVDHSSISDVPGVVKIVERGNFLGVVATEEWRAVKAAQQLKVTWAEPATLPQMNNLYHTIRTTDGDLNSPLDAVVDAAGRLLANNSDSLVVTKNALDASMGTVDRVVYEQGDLANMAAAQIAQATYHWPFQAHASIGPSCAVADVKKDRVTVWSGAQHPHGLRSDLAYILGIPLEQIEVIYRAGSGCYGRLAADDAAVDAVFLSQAVNRPVRVQWMRHDEHTWAFMGPAMVCHVRGGIDAQGNVTGWDYELWSPSHFVPPLLIDQLDGWALGTQFADGSIPNFYEFANRRILLHVQPSAVLRYGNLRALSSLASSFAGECFVDELAALANADAIEFRLRYLIEPRAVAVLKAVARLANWQVRQSAMLKENTGRGVALAEYAGTWVAMVAEVSVEPDSGQIQVDRIFVAHDCGLIVNPDGLKNQIEGNVIQSVSRTLKEEVKFDAGITTRDWASYPILNFTEIPQVEIELLNQLDMVSLGAGEPATVPPPAAISNAVFDATGVRLRTVPFTPERFLQTRQG